MAVDSVEQVSGMVIIIIMTWELEELELLVPGTATTAVPGCWSLTVYQHSAFMRAQGYYERLAANYISIVFGSWCSNATDDVASILCLRTPLLIITIKTCHYSPLYYNSNR